MRLQSLDNNLFIVYMIEGQFPKSSRHYSYRWFTRELTPAHFGERNAKYGEPWDKACPTFKEYGANGDCWQATGLNGFLNRELALQAFSKIIKYAPPNKSVVKWRLVRRTITVKLEQIAQCNAGLVTT